MSTVATCFRSCMPGAKRDRASGKGREGKGREGKGEARGREERKVSPVVLDVLPRSKCCVLQNCLCQIHGCEEDVDV
jgi:hypothetical protein